MSTVVRVTNDARCDHDAVTFSSEITHRVRELSSPTPTDVQRCVEALVAHLRDIGGTGRVTELEALTLESVGAPAHLERRQKVTVDGIEQVRADDPVLTHIRYLQAFETALARLLRAGAVEPIDPNDSYCVSVTSRGTTGGVNLGVAKPQIRTNDVRLVAGSQPPEAAEPSLFLAGLDGLALDERARRSLEEAIHAFRRGLYLACVNLLGGVFEAAWYSAGARVPDPPNKLANALANHRTRDVVRLVAERFRQGASDSVRFEVDELVAHTGVMRAVRNYGVHPRTDSDPALEHHFTEHGAGLLLMQSRLYLLRLDRFTLAQNGQTDQSSWPDPLRSVHLL